MAKTRKALCIGVRYAGHIDSEGESLELDGSHADARRVTELLAGYGYEVEVLLDNHDETGLKPTKVNIALSQKAAIERLVQGAQPGDCLFFHFSGHGDQIKNEDGTETDGWDEVILPLDWEMDPDHMDRDDRKRYFPNRIILDDELHKWLVKALPDGCYLNALFDNCHSGTALDLPYCRRYDHRDDLSVLAEKERICDEPDSLCSPIDAMSITVDRGFPVPRRKNSLGSKGSLEFSYSAPIAQPNRVRELQSSSGKIMRSGSLILRGDSQDPGPDKMPSQGGYVYSWGACADAQESQESPRGGLMVEAFLACLKENRYPTYRELLHSLNARLRKKCLEINNQLSRRPLGDEEVPLPVRQDPQFGSYMPPDMDAVMVL